MSPIIGSFSSGSIFGKRRSGGIASGQVVATGGTVSSITVGGINYIFHTFTSTGTFTITSGAAQIDVFLVGGGGGGGMLGGGGGGGGVMVASATGVPLSSYSVTVGNGGTGETGWQGITTDGGQSSVFGLVSRGGGLGRSYSGGASGNVTVANSGGNRYGGTSGIPASGQPAPSGIWSGTGYGGFTGGSGDSACCSCRGGGGAGAGQNGFSYNSPGNGGNGIIINFDGNNHYWGGGGGNDGYCSNTGGSGGLGGGGGGAGQASRGSAGGSARNSGSLAQLSSGDGNGGAGGANTGGGGGAGCNGNGAASILGGAGGSGIVMIRYRP